MANPAELKEEERVGDGNFKLNLPRRHFHGRSGHIHRYIRFVSSFDLRYRDQKTALARETDESGLVGLSSVSVVVRQIPT